MSSTILTNWTVYYADDQAAGAGMKQVRWTGAGAPETNTNTVNQLYSALMDLFSIPDQNNADDTAPMRAVTPSVYNIGAFDAGDEEPWFIDPVSIQHLTGGSLSTVGWTRSLPGDGTGDIGILMVQCNSGGTFTMTSADVGDTCSHTDGDTGVILYVDTTNAQVWIRPTDNTLANDFNSTTGGTITAGTSPNRTVVQATSIVGASGERVWANLYSIGTIAANTQLYVTQSFSTFPSSPWWGAGHLDRLFLTSDGFDAGLIDDGLLTVYARDYTRLYDNFTADVSGGGRSPVPLATSADVNNTSGYYTMTVTGSSGTWNVGNYIYYDNGGALTWSTTTKKGIITAVAGSNLTYGLLGDLTNFSASGTESVKEYTGTADGDASATDITAVNPAGPTTGNPAAITVTFGYTSQDIGDGGGNQPYSVTIDMNGNTSIAELYNRLKYLTRRGETTTIDDNTPTPQTIIGNQYIAIGDILLPYDGQSTSFVQGETINGQDSGATGIVTADNTTDTILTIRDVRGTFQDDENLRSGATVRAVANIPTGAESITPVKVNPFGTKAGDNFFGARGIWLANTGAYANNFELIDNNGERRIPPTTVPVTVNKVVAGDRVSVFIADATDSNNIKKDFFTSHASANSGSSTTFTVTATIPADTPYPTGFIRIRKTSTGVEERLAYTTWSGTAFTLSSSHSGGYDGTDTAYVGYIDDTASGTSMSTSVQYVTERPITVRVRKKGIQPFITTGSLNSGGYTVDAIRISDSIVN